MISWKTSLKGPVCISPSRKHLRLKTLISKGEESKGIFLETLISVHDREAWVAELDVLGALGSPQDRLIREFLEYRSCRHGASPTKGPEIISIRQSGRDDNPTKTGGHYPGKWEVAGLIGCCFNMLREEL